MSEPSFSTSEAAAPLDEAGREALRERVIDAIRTCYDPEIPVNIYELGLIYDVIVAEDRSVLVRMTLTTPHCFAAETLPPEVEEKARGVEGVARATVEVVWEPPWTMDRMSEAAKLELNLY